MPNRKGGTWTQQLARVIGIQVQRSLKEFHGQVRLATEPSTPAGGQGAASHHPGSQWQTACTIGDRLGLACAGFMQLGGDLEQQLQVCRTWNTTRSAVAGVTGSRGEAQVVPSHSNRKLGWRALQRAEVACTTLRLGLSAP
jgi:hypothetical protein